MIFKESNKGQNFLSKIHQSGGKIKLRPITHPPQIFQEEAIFWKPE